MYVRTYVRTYVRMYVCMYVCMYVYKYMYIYIYIYIDEVLSACTVTIHPATNTRNVAPDCQYMDAYIRIRVTCVVAPVLRRMPRVQVVPVVIGARRYMLCAFSF